MKAHAHARTHTHARARARAISNTSRVNLYRVKTQSVKWLLKTENSGEDKNAVRIHILYLVSRNVP